MKIIGWLMPLALLAASADQPLSVQDLLEEKLLDRIRSIDQSINGVLGVAVIDLSANRTISWHGDTEFPQASSIKIPIMAQVYRDVQDGRLKMDSAVKLESSDAVEGSGHLKMLLRSRPITLTVAELTTAMIETSDNTATNRLIAMVGKDRVNEQMEQLGFHHTRLRRIMLDSAAAARNEDNVSAPLEMARLMELIYRGKLVHADASRKMLDTLKLVEADFRFAIPGAVPVAAKPGELTGVRCETGVVLLKDRPFVLSVMSSYLDDGSNPVPVVARAVYEYFAKLAASNVYGNRVH